MFLFDIQKSKEVLDRNEKVFSFIDDVIVISDIAYVIAMMYSKEKYLEFFNINVYDSTENVEDLILFDLLTRSEKNIFEHLKKKEYDKSLLDEILTNQHIYEIALKTKLYYALDNMLDNSIITNIDFYMNPIDKRKINLLGEKFMRKNEKINIVTQDMENLPKYIEQEGYTSLFINDIEFLNKLYESGIDLELKTIYLSNLFYNHKYNEIGYMPKYNIEKMILDRNCNILIVDLFDVNLEDGIKG